MAERLESLLVWALAFPLLFLSSSSYTQDFVYQEFNISVFCKCIDGQNNLHYRDEADSMVIKNKINTKGESRLQ